MMRLPDGLRRRLRGAAVRLRGFRGHLDGEIGGALVGWVQLAPGGATQKPAQKPPQQAARVGLYARGALLAQATANVHRRDLEAAGVNGGFAGFVIPLTPEIRAMVTANGGRADLRLITPRAPLLDHWRASPDTRSGPVPPPVQPGPPVQPVPSGANPLALRLYGDLQRLARRLTAPGPPAPDPRPATPVQARLFSARDPLDGTALPAPMFAYAEFLRRRDRLDARFDPARDPAEMAGFLRHYLEDYGTLRAGLRIPLSAEAIGWLNTPLEDGLSRAARMFAKEAPPTGPDPLEALYHWAAEQAPALYAEDCLVPEGMAARLAEVPYPDTAAPDATADTRWPLSRFMTRFVRDVPELAALPLTTEQGRRDLTCALMVMALSRPDLLRYLPPASVQAALAGGALAAFCARMGTALPGLSRAGYAHALRQQGFDLERLRFLSFTAEGHRAEFARLPDLPAPYADRSPDVPPERTPERTPDVQVIGPFRKASGLGQATRLSAQVLDQAGFAVHRVDFTLDNPAPEDASRAAAAGYRRAPVNLFHLNAETLPFAVAYLPDIFSGAHNILYPFWELDSPGTCHFLGLGMADELWVASRFSQDSFQPHTDRPVTHVGMTFEALPEIPRGPARAFLEQKTGVRAGQFTFLVTFDSFSFLKRKNPLGALTAFARAFPDRTPGQPDVRLVIKTQNRARVTDPAQAPIWAQIDAAVAADPRLVLLDDTLPYTDVLRLKAGADAYLSLHRSEGWGFGMIEAMNLGLPVVATGYSGNMDFCDDDTCWLVDHTLTEVGPEEYIFVHPGQVWAEPDPDHAARQMRAVYENAEARARRARAALERVQRDFSHLAIAARYGARLRRILNRAPQGQEDNREGNRGTTGG